MSSCCSSILATKFDATIARGDRERYDREGPIPTTRLLRDSLLQSGRSGTVLDIGAGVGALGFELLRAGVAGSVTAVDASPAYAAAGLDEAHARSEDRLTYVTGDFVELAPNLSHVDIVTLDRVVCCYPDCIALLATAAGHARSVVALSYPKDRWYIRVAIATQNRLRAIRHDSFRTYVHSEALIDSLLRAAGFQHVSSSGTFVWRVTVYARPAMPSVA